MIFKNSFSKYIIVFLFTNMILVQPSHGKPLRLDIKKWSPKWMEQFLKFIDFCDEYDVMVDEESDCQHYLMCGLDNQWHHNICPGNWGFSSYYNTCVPYVQSQCSPTVEQDYYEDWYLEEDNKSKWWQLLNLWNSNQRKFFSS